MSDEEFEKYTWLNESILYDEWDTTGGDFTKKFNRMKSQLQSITQFKGQISNLMQKPITELHNKFQSRINVELLSSQAKGSRKADHGKYMVRDKQDRATVEQVLDPRTRMIILKLINTNAIYEINGCISTGKEANVYHATNDSNGNLAVKIYKTSILVFKDRDKYVTGEFRFRHGYCKSNPRKMVQTWAEKEFRNLKRLLICGIPCPVPLILKSHVLVMSMIGSSSGNAAPRLKDTVIETLEEFSNLYIQLVKMLWTLYNKCSLVHADFSEYNLLYHKKVVYCIDVSQSVENDHPHALEFLRKDVANVVEYFRKMCGERIWLGLLDLFDLVVSSLDNIRNKLYDKDLNSIQSKLTLNRDLNETDLILELYLERVPITKKLLDRVSNRTEAETITAKANEQVFKQVFIPRSLEEVVDHETDIQNLRDGDVDMVLLFNQVVYKAMAGLDINQILDPIAEAVDGDTTDTLEADSQESITENEYDQNDFERPKQGTPKAGLKKDEDKSEKKERKKLVRDAKAQKRMEKVPKALKKQKTKKKVK